VIKEFYMEAKLVVVNRGWAVVNNNWTAFGETVEEAISKFKVIAARHMQIEARKQNEKKEMMID
jgi:hypothetical protein